MTAFDLLLVRAPVALGSATLKVTAILAVAAVLARLLHRHTAALRHLIWTAALGATIAVLALPAVLPAWRVIPAPPVSPGTIAAGATEALPPLARDAAEPPTIGPTPSPLRSPSSALTGPPTTSRQTTTRDRELPALVLGLWFLGVASVAFRYLASRIALRRLARSSVPHAECALLVEQICRRMHIDRPVRLRGSDDVELPFTWGVFRPQIVLPSDAAEWAPDRRRHVLEHELAHVRRLDAGTQLVAQMASALFWFHPLVWYAVGQMRCERERACDDHVLSSGANAADYAGDLLALVTNYKYVERHSAALAFAGRSHFEGRLLALLDRDVDRGVLSPRRIALVLSVSLAFVVPFAAVRSAEPRVVPVEIANTPLALRPSSLPGPGPLVPVSRVAAPPATLDRPGRAPSAQPDAEDVFAGCALRMTHNDSDASSDNAGNTIWTASGSNDECGFALESNGQVVYSGDATTIVSISRGGYFAATTNIRGNVTSLVVRAPATDGGPLSYQFTRGGRPLDVSGAGPTWLRQFLLGVDRTTGFAIDSRFPALFQAGGSGALLTEIGRMHSDHVKEMYLRRLVQDATLDADAIRRTGDIVASMGAGHMAAEVIVAIATKYALTDSTARAAFLGTALAMAPDQERARTLLSILTAASLRGDETLAILGSVTTISTDRQKARVLLGIAGTQRLDGALRSAWLHAAETIHDDRERSRAVAGLASR